MGWITAEAVNYAGFHEHGFRIATRTLNIDKFLEHFGSRIARCFSPSISTYASRMILDHEMFVEAMS